MRSQPLKSRSGTKLFSPILCFLLTGMFVFPASAQTKRVYRPTAAQLRVEQQNREREARIQAIRRQQAAKPAPAPVQQKSRNQVKPAASPAVKKTVPPAAPPAPARIRYINYQSKRFVLVQDIAKFYGMKITYAKNGITLRSPRDTVTLRFEKRMAEINGVTTYLTHAPLQRGALVYLDEKDFLLAVDPVIRNAPLGKHPLKTVLIDPGHGGKDRGAPGVSGLLEKNLTLAIAKQLALKLRSRGCRVFMTRITDRQLTLQQRVAMCGKLKPDLFISVHCNAVGNRKSNGIETYALTPKGAASTSDTKPVDKTFSGNAFNRNNYRLAFEIQKNLLASTKAEDRGVRHARFVVIRDAVCPAVLIETGFITHPQEGLRLNQKAYQDKLVNGIVSGVSAYARAVRPAVKPAAAKPSPGARKAGK